MTNAGGTPLIDDVWTRFAGDANVYAFRVPLGEGMERMGRLKYLAVSTGVSCVKGSCPQKPRPVSPVKLVTS